MHPAMQRRRRHTLTRRNLRRGSSRRGWVVALVVLMGTFVVLVGGSVAGTAGGALLAYQHFASGLPSPDILDAVPLPQSTYVYDRSGTVLLARFECQNRESVSFAQLPSVIVDATVASEDQTFWTNNGVDVNGVARAALANLQAGHIVQGASTITQQVIKYAGSIVLESEASAAAAASPVALTGDVPDTTDSGDVCPAPRLTFLEGRGFQDKIQEQIFAMEVTKYYADHLGLRGAKEKILSTYLNLIYYGNGSYGIKAAAANYFGLTDISQLTIAQAAFLAALPQRPSKLDPYQNPNGAVDAMQERDGVLFRMLDEGYINQAQYDEAKATSWEQMGPSRVVHPLLEPQFSFRVQREAEQILASLGVTDTAQAIRTGGYTITTTLDYPLQQVAKEEVTTWVRALADKNVHNGALVAIDSATGEIVAYVGSVDYYDQDDPRVDGAFDVAGLGRRQPGSAFKPIVYTSAFRAREATVSTMLVDAVTEFGTEGTSYKPTNADIKQHGPVLATDALRYSLNVPSVQMAYLAGPDTAARLADELGVAGYDYIMAQDPGLSIGLGTVPVNLTGLTQGYSVFAEEGTVHPATTVIEIKDRDGNVIYSRDTNGPKATSPLTKAEAYLTHWILESNTDPKRNLLWGKRARLVTPDGIRRHAGFKTGTTNDFKDVTGVGYVPGSLTVGVWMGNNNQEPMSNKLGQGLFSADGPLYLWHDFMTRALNEPWDWNGKQPVPSSDFAKPDGVVNALVCRFSGMGATTGCGPTQTMPFLVGTVPPADNVHHSDEWHPDGCFDLVQFVSQEGRPRRWVDAAAAFSDWVNNGALAKSKSTEAIVPLYGNASMGQPFCGELMATPTPNPSFPFPSGFCSGNPHLCPTPTPTPNGTPGGPPAPVGGTFGGGLPGLFLIPVLLGLLPYLVRLRRRH